VSVVTDGREHDRLAVPWEADGAGEAVPPEIGDEALLAALRHAIGARQSVPPEFVQAAKDAFAWHNIDAELAQLTFDSTLGHDLARTRAEAASIRALTFTSARLTIDLEVTADSVLGQIVPTQAAEIEVQARSGAGTVIASDDIGCFVIRPIPRGSFRLHCRAVGGVDVLTGWITL
jgi:hypothetical protein